MKLDKSRMEYFNELLNTYYKKWMQQNFENAKWYESYCVEFADKRKTSQKPLFHYYSKEIVERAMNSGKIKFLGDVFKDEGEGEQHTSNIPKEDFIHIWNYIFGRILKNKDLAIESLVNSNYYFNVEANEPTLKLPLILTTDKSKAGIYKDCVVFAVNASNLEKALTTYKSRYFTNLKNEIYVQASTLKLIRKNAQ